MLSYGELVKIQILIKKISLGKTLQMNMLHTFRKRTIRLGRLNYL